LGKSGKSVVPICTLGGRTIDGATCAGNSRRNYTTVKGQPLEKRIGKTPSTEADTGRYMTQQAEKVAEHETRKGRIVFTAKQTETRTIEKRRHSKCRNKKKQNEKKEKQNFQY
jgi:hypothetical protein